MRAVIYCRISRDKVGAGLGVESQEGDCRKLCSDRGWDVSDVLVDNDISASRYSRKRRPGYRRLLEMVRAGDVDRVVSWHTDRLHRTISELEEYIAACEPMAVSTHTVKAGHLDLTTSNGRMIARVSAAIAAGEVEHMQERVARAKERAAEAGTYRGGPRPFGYESDGVTVRASEAARVLAGSEAILAGRSVRSLVAEWNGGGVPTVGGREWRHTGLRRILLRARNAGLVEHDGVVVGRAEWPAIVPEETWRGVVAVLSDPSRVTTTASGRRWLGSGLYVCGQCGGPVIVGNSNGLPSYRCGPSGCRGVTRTAEHVDAFVEAGVVERLRSGFGDVLAEGDGGEGERLGGQVRALRARLDELGAMFAAGEMDREQTATASRLLRTQLEQAEQSLARLAGRSQLAGVAGAADPGRAWLDAELGVRRAVLAALATVTLLPSGRGRPAGWRPGEPYFRHESVDIAWR